MSRLKTWQRGRHLLRSISLPVFLPTSSGRVRWVLWTLMCAIYMSIDGPLLIAFEPWREERIVHYTGWVACVTFSLDILLNFRTAYMSAQGELVRNPQMIAQHYVRTMFFLDLLSALPIDEIVGATTTGSVHEHAYWLSLLRLPRMLLLLRHLDTLVPVKYLNLVSLGRLLFGMLLITHYAACLWYYLAWEIGGSPWIFTVWCVGWPARDKYLFVFYRCFLLILGDRPLSYNNVERTLCVLLLTVGTCFYAIIMSSMTMLISNIWSMAARHKQRASAIQDVLRYNDASAEMRVKINTYFDYMAERGHPGSDGMSFLSELPSAMHAEMVASLFEPMLGKVQLFAECEHPFRWRLAQRLRLVLYMPGDMVYDIDSVSHEMYLVWKGAVGLVDSDGAMTTLCTDGDHFGELGVMVASMPRPHRAVVMQMTDILTLTRWDLADAMRDFPESAALVKGRARVQLEDHEIALAVWMAMPALEQQQQQLQRTGTRTRQAGLDAGCQQEPIQDLIRPMASSPLVTADASSSELGPCQDFQDAVAGVLPARSGDWTGNGVRHPSMTTCGPRLRRRAQARSGQPPGSGEFRAPGPVTEATGDGACAVTSQKRDPARYLARIDSDQSRSSDEAIYSALYRKEHRMLAAPTPPGPEVPPLPHPAEAIGRTEPRVLMHQRSRRSRAGIALLQPTPQLHARDDRRFNRWGSCDSSALEMARLSAVRAAGESNAPQSRLMRAVHEAIAASASIRGGGAYVPGGADITPSRAESGRAEIGSISDDMSQPLPLGNSSQAGREGASAAQMLVMPPQPFLGLDPLDGLYDDASAKPPYNADTDLWRSARGTAPFVSPSGAADMMAGDTDDLLSQQFLAGRNPAQRNMKPGLRASIARTNSSRMGTVLRLPDDEIDVERAVEKWLQGQSQASSCRGHRCAHLEQQLAQAQRQLQEVKSQIALMQEAPLKIPSMREALSREVSRVEATLSARTESILERLLEMLQGLAVRTEDLTHQVASADDRLQQLEEAEDLGFGRSVLSDGGSVRVALEGRDAAPRTLPGKEAAASVGNVTLPPLGTGSVTFGCFSAAWDNSSGAGAGGSAGAFKASGLSLKQPSYMARSRRLSALSYLHALHAEGDLSAPHSPVAVGAAAAELSLQVSSSNTAGRASGASQQEAGPSQVAPAKRASSRSLPRRRSTLDLAALVAITSAGKAAPKEDLEQLQQQRKLQQPASGAAAQRQDVLVVKEPSSASLTASVGNRSSAAARAVGQSTDETHREASI